MALKEKALKRLTEKLAAAQVHWALGGDYALTLRGEETAWHSFELLTDAASAAAADKVLTKLGMRHEEDAAPAAFRCAYHFDGADILLTAGPAATVEGQALRLRLDAAAAAEKVAVLGAQVPLLRLEDQLVLSVLQGDEAGARRVAALLKKTGIDMDRVRGCTEEPLPEAILTDIAALMEAEG